ncbi:MAG TPA: iron-containing redox enzyme family protein [Candidatus Acidoferrales bacterium]|nr:iron-containing redox enzyme family protein [Candidatus Acidoferrales bacterium]
MFNPNRNVQHADLVRQLDQELTRMARAQYETPEFNLLFSTPLTIERARINAILTVYYGVNRRDCWAYVQARSPYEIKKIIWEHEKDELCFDSRGGADHQTLQFKEANALGLTQDDVRNYVLPPLIVSCFYAWLHIASTFPWLGVLTAFHALERRNSDKLIPGGGISRRWRDKLVNEAEVPLDQLASTNVHVQADVDHADSIWEAIAPHVTDEFAVRTALEGAAASYKIDAAYRAASALALRAV